MERTLIFQIISLLSSKIGGYPNRHGLFASRIVELFDIKLKDKRKKKTNEKKKKIIS